MEVKNKILLKAEEMFMQYGIKSVTMDDLSRTLGISKKTLYQYVDNKKDLINQIISFYLNREMELTKSLREKAADAIEELILISRHVNKTLQSINPAAMYDLQKYYAKQFALMRSFNDQFVYSIIKDNLEKGVKEGLYRDNFNSYIIAKFYVGSSDLLLDQKVFPFEKYKRPEIHQEIILYHLYAIVTEEGRKRLEQYLDQKEK